MTFQTALDNFTTDAAEQERALRLLHALISDCRQAASLEEKSDVEMATETKCFGRMIEQLEKKITSGASPFVRESTRHVAKLPRQNNT